MGDIKDFFLHLGHSRKPADSKDTSMKHPGWQRKKTGRLYSSEGLLARRPMEAIRVQASACGCDQAIQDEYGRDQGLRIDLAYFMLGKANNRRSKPLHEAGGMEPATRDTIYAMVFVYGQSYHDQIRPCYLTVTDLHHRC